MKEHKISIITISYNSEKTIEETILSVINQKYSNFEYIIIDGGSKDNTLSIVNKYKSSITKVISEPDNGICDAFNKGLRECSGEIIGIINSDDILNIDTLATLNNVLEKYPNYDIYYGNGIIFDSKNNYVYKPKNDIHDILKYMFICHPATFVKKECYERFGNFDINYKCAMDFELLSRMYLKGAKFKYFDYECTWYRLGGVSKKRSNLTKEESIKIAIRNSINASDAINFFNTMEKREKYIQFARKIGIEGILRKIRKKQEKTKYLRNWYKNKED